MNPAQQNNESEETSRLHLVAATAPRKHSLLALWHLLSLDAPTVAALWTYFIAHASGVKLAWQSPAAMFVAVWMLYAADRLLDARPLLGQAAAQELEERHRFHHRHRQQFLIAIALAAPVLALLLHQLPAATLHLYVLLATLLAAWLLLIHARSLEAHRLPKELAVGLCFPAAVFIPTVASAPQLRLTLLAPALCFAAVCTLNCLFVYAWEHPTQHSKAHATTRWGLLHLPALTALAFVACLLAERVSHLIPIACALSTCAFIALHHRRHHIAPTTLRALADAALLTPLLLLAR